MSPGPRPYYLEMLNSENELGEDGDKKSHTELRVSGGSSPVVNYTRRARMDKPCLLIVCLWSN